MKRLKNYTLLLSAFTFIILGAALPYLTSQMQDTQISRAQIKMELKNPIPEQYSRVMSAQFRIFHFRKETV